jgi:hypothetical protein
VIWTGVGIIGPVTLLFVGAVLLARPLAFIPALLPANLSWKNRSLIAWFGPRALSSLLLVLLPVFSDLPGSERLLTICCLVVLFSVVLHGLSPSILIKPPRETPPEPVLPKTAPDEVKVVLPKILNNEATLELAEPIAEQPAEQPAGQQCSLTECSLPAPAPVQLSHPEYITIPEVKALQERLGQVAIIDSRTVRTYEDSDETIPGSYRLSPEHAVRDANERKVPKEVVLAILCA